MAKLMVIGDQHLGHRSGDRETAEYQIRVFDEFIFPLMLKLGIKHVIQTGDFFDARKAIRHDTMELVREKLIPKTKGQEWHVLVGNHDMHLKESIFPNSCNELLAGYENFTIYNEPGVLEVDGIKIDMIPWICRDNRKQVLDFIANSSNNIAVGHFELAGFQYYRGMASQGEDAHFLANYSQVWSGHFHTISKANHILYVGTPYQLTFGDADDERGVWVYDTDDGTFEFHNNNMPRFSRIYFDHSTFDEKNLERYKDMYLNIQVKSRGDTKKFDKLIDKLITIAREVKVKDVLDSNGGTSSAPTLNNLLTTAEVIDQYIDTLEETEEDRTKIKRFMMDLYREAESH
jgi:DNA repair exonuclease SbcCD nuclease subunit